MEVMKFDVRVAVVNAVATAGWISKQGRDECRAWRECDECSVMVVAAVIAAWSMRPDYSRSWGLRRRH